MFWIFDIILSHVASAAFHFSLWIVWNYYFKQQLTQYLCVACKTAKLWARSQISLANILVTRMHSSRMHTAWTLLYGGGEGLPDRNPPGQRLPWTETLLDRASINRDPPWQRTPLDRDPPGQRPPWTENPPVNRMTYRCKNITFPELRCGW